MNNYIYGIVDPLTEKICFIGVSGMPWKAITRHMYGAGNKELTEHLNTLQSYFPGKKMAILESVVADKYYDPKIKLPPTKPNEFRLKWEILGQTKTHSKQQIIHEYKGRGEAWFNRALGRPEGYSLKLISTLTREKTIRKQIKENELIENAQHMTDQQILEAIEYLQGILISRKEEHDV